MDWILSTLVLAGNILIGRKVKWGWIVMIANSIAWVYYAWVVLEPPQYGLIPSAVINLFISAAAAWKWFREDRQAHRALNDFGVGYD